MPSPTLFVTDDGSHSLRDAKLGISYHSTHGAIQESRHIFIEAGVRPLLEPPPLRLRVLELGLGTGLNALLLRELAAAYTGTDFEYVTYEPFPVGVQQARQLNYPEQLGVDPARLAQLHECAWEEAHQLDANFRFTKYQRDFLTLLPSEETEFSVLFFDAFAPEDQPELWTIAAMQLCFDRLSPGGCLVTYCAKGEVRRNLRAAGFRTEKLPGPVGKREITRAWRGVA